MTDALVAAGVHALLVSCLGAVVMFAVVAIVVRSIALDAGTRHALWTAAVCATALIPLTGLAVSAVRAVSVAVAPPDAQRRANAATTGDQSHRTHDRTNRAPQTGSVAGEPTLALDFAGRTARIAAALRPNRIVGKAIVGAWLAGVVVGLAGLTLSLNRVRGLKRRSSPLDGELAGELPWLTHTRRGEREIYLRLSYETETPVAIGFRRPVILIPTELAAQGGLRAIEGLVMHEHAHLRRRDDWTNILQRVIERVFWFNPLVWLIGRQIALEREIAADDAVVAATGEPERYAQSLWQLAREMRMPEHSVVAPGALFTRKQISIRIEALLERQPTTARLRPVAAFAVGVAALSCTVAVAAGAPALELPALRADRVHPAALAFADRAAATPSPVGASRPIRSASSAATPAPAPVVKPVTPMTASPAGSIERQPDVRVTLPPLAPHLDSVPPAMSAGIARDLQQAAASAVADGAAVSAVARHGGVATIAPPPLSPNATALARSLSCTGCDLSGRDLRNDDLRGLALTSADLSGADLRGARLDGARFIDVDLGGVKLDRASLRNATFTSTSIDGTTFRDADVSGMKMIGVSLADTDLHGLDLRSILMACAGCDLNGADLRGAILRDSHLVGANMSDANLQGADLSGGSFAGVNFSSADLHAANLRGSNFIGANFSDADLRGADVRGANFTGAIGLDLSQSRR